MKTMSSMTMFLEKEFEPLNERFAMQHGIERRQGAIPSTARAYKKLVKI